MLNKGFCRAPSLHASHCHISISWTIAFVCHSPGGGGATTTATWRPPTSWPAWRCTRVAARCPGRGVPAGRGPSPRSWPTRRPPPPSRARPPCWRASGTAPASGRPRRPRGSHRRAADAATSATRATAWTASAPPWAGAAGSSPPPWSSTTRCPRTPARAGPAPRRTASTTCPCRRRQHPPRRRPPQRRGSPRGAAARRARRRRCSSPAWPSSPAGRGQTPASRYAHKENQDKALQSFSAPPYLFKWCGRTH